MDIFTVLVFGVLGTDRTAGSVDITDQVSGIKCKLLTLINTDNMQCLLLMKEMEL